MSVSIFPNGLVFNKVFAALIMAFTLVLTGCGAGSETSESQAQTDVEPTTGGEETGDAGNDEEPVEEEPAETFVLNLLSQPTSATITEGESHTFSVSVEHDHPITVVWFRNGTVVQSSASTAFTATAAGTYDCSGTDGNSTLYCSDFSLTVEEAPYVTITGQPANQMVNEGVNVSLSVAADGNGSLTYQWYFNGSPVSGATGSTLSLNNITVEQGGAYHVVVSNAGETATSRTATVDVSANLASALISWSRPLKRADDTDLAASEIQGYEIYHGASAGGEMTPVDSVSADELEYTVTGLEQGTHYFSLVTVDTSGMKSNLSAPVSVTIN